MSQSTLQTTALNVAQLPPLNAPLPPLRHKDARGRNTSRVGGDTIALSVIGGLAGGAALGAGIYHLATLKAQRASVFVPENLKTLFSTLTSGRFGQSALDALHADIQTVEGMRNRLTPEQFSLALEQRLRNEVFPSLIRTAQQNRADGAGDELTQVLFAKEKLRHFLDLNGLMPFGHSRHFKKLAAYLRINDIEPREYFGEHFSTDREQRNVLRIVGHLWGDARELTPLATVIFSQGVRTIGSTQCTTVHRSILSTSTRENGRSHALATISSRGRRRRCKSRLRQPLPGFRALAD